MAKFAALDEFLDGVLELPILGADGVTRVYRIDPPDAEMGFWLERMFAAGIASKSAENDEQLDAIAARMQNMKPPGDLPDDITLHQLILGSAFGAMVADRVSWPMVKHAAQTMLTYTTMGEEAATAIWQSAGQGKPPAPTSRGARRKTSNRTGGAKKTPTLDSGSGTTSRKAGSRKPTPAA